ncbi:hypothetical protein D3C84_492150 [compost metagenome]
MALQHTEFAARYRRRGQHGAARAIPLPALGRVIADPHRAVAQGAQSKGLVVVPQLPTVDHASLQGGEREDARCVVHEFAHQQVAEALLGILTVQLGHVEQVAAAAHRIFHRDNLAPLTIATELSFHQVGVAQVKLDLIGLGPALVELLTRPEFVCRMGEAGGGGEVGLTPLLVHRHPAGHVAKIRKAMDPEVFVHVDVAMVPLRGAGVGAEEVEVRPVRQHHGVALELHPFCVGKLDDVLLEDVGL